MSLDLLKEFGTPTLTEEVNPWATTCQHDHSNLEDLEQDEFGDFEEAESNPKAEDLIIYPSQHNTGAARKYDNQQNLLIDPADTKPPPSPSFQELNAPLKLHIPPANDQANRIDANPENSTPITAWPSYSRDRAESFGKPLPLSPYLDDEDDEWGDFEAGSEGKDTSAEAPRTQTLNSETLPRQGAEEGVAELDLPITDGSLMPESPPTIETAKISTTGPPPSNIPPPSIHLAVVVTICQKLPTVMSDTVRSMSTQAINGEYGPHDPHIQRLETMQTQLNAAAHILAGRKWRWKRDTHLAQSMRIGTANAGRAAGMKLTGVDRSEARREDQEAAEVVRLWKQQVGSLKGQIAKINALQSHIHIILPDFADNLPIRTAKAGEGALTAVKSCFLCGLKRDERVARLDVNVEDSFDEWWVEHWGHVDCIRFWERHSRSLKQR
ncbi:MAG: hypothetical protein LQ350_002329 [Teloschistes chrysophthalmus]|nr:MAG: hypothetical protein LQ350_002329 [Niorma chrysophthalma]